MTHALARRRGLPGDERHDRLLHVPADELRGLFLVAAADLAHQHDPLGLRIGLEQGKRFDEAGADHRIAADTEARGLPEPGAAQLVHHFVGEGSAARDHADRARLADVARQDAHLGEAGADQARAVGTDQARPAVRRPRAVLALAAHAGDVVIGGDRVAHRNAFGDAHDQSDPGIGGLEDRVGRERGRHVDH